MIRRTLAATVTVLGLGLLGCPSTPTPPPAPPPPGVTVLLRRGLLPLAGEAVEALRDPAGTVAATATTDAAGNARFQLAPGRYRFAASSGGISAQTPPLLAGAGAVYRLILDLDPLPPTRTYFVDGANPLASDANPGTEALPWQTLGHAARTLGPDERALVKEHRYAESVVFARSGSRDAPISLEAFPTQEVVVDGGGTRAYAFRVEPDARGRPRGHIRIAGFRVRGFREAGVLATAAPDLIVEGCRFEGGRQGVRLESSRDARLRFNCFQEQSDAGVQLSGGREALVQANRFERAATGVRLSGGADCDLFQNAIREAGVLALDVDAATSASYRSDGSLYVHSDPTRDLVRWGRAQRRFRAADFPDYQRLSARDHTTRVDAAAWPEIELLCVPCEGLAPPTDEPPPEDDDDDDDDEPPPEDDDDDDDEWPPEETGDGWEPNEGEGEEEEPIIVQPPRPPTVHPPEDDPGPTVVQPEEEPERTGDPPERPNDDVREGDPVTIVNQELVHTVSDLRIRCERGFHLEFRRTYRSQVAYAGPLGQGWDFNLNDRLTIRSGGEVVHHDGAGRMDVFREVSPGVFHPDPGVYELLERRPDGTWARSDAHRAVFHYDAAGRLLSLTDRNGNALRCLRGPGGRLDAVIDTQDRRTRFEYSSFGRIVAIEDFAGRRWRYAYNARGELTHVSYPPTADRPAGQTWRYTYQVAPGDRRLDHGLLTVTDPKGATYLRNRYTPDGKLLSQRQGRGEFLFARVGAQLSVQDRAGNLRRHTVGANRQVTKLEVFRTHTAAPGTPPTRKQTVEFAYNAQGERTRVLLARGNERRYVYDDGNPDPRAQGNLLEARRVAGRLGTQPDEVASYSYEPRFNRLKTMTDPRGNRPGAGPAEKARYTTTFSFDYEEAAAGDLNGDGRTDQRAGNVVRVEGPLVPNAGGPEARSVTRLVYNDAGQVIQSVDAGGSVHRLEYFPSNGVAEDPSDFEGYLRAEVHDAGSGVDPRSGRPHVNARWEYAVSPVGNRTGVTDPKGNLTTVVYDARDLVREVVGPAPSRYRTTYRYDANDNLQRLNSENVRFDPSSGTHRRDLQNPWVSTYYLYDGNDNLIEKLEEIERTRFRRLRYRYDGADRVVRVIHPEGNQQRFVYDERGEVVLQTAAPGTRYETTQRFEYDGNGNLIRHARGTGAATRYAYDAFDRRVSIVTAEGAVTRLAYDSVGNLQEDRRLDRFGRVLARTRYEVDAANRVTVRTEDRFDRPDDLANARAERTRFSRDLAGRVVGVTDALGRSGAARFDGLGRWVDTRDPLGNVIEYTHDPNGRLILRVEREVAGGGLPASARHTRYDRDEHDRVVRTVDELGHTRRYGYNQWHQLVVFSDARGPTNAERFRGAALNDPGNSTELHYDGLGRRVREVRHLRRGGVGQGAIVGARTRTWRYDDNDQLVAAVDGKGNTVRMRYDAVERLIRVDYPDGSFERMAHDRDHNVVYRKDRRGTVVCSRHDGDGRLVHETIERALGVLGPTFTRREYDGLSRLVRAANDETVCTFRYDSRGNLLEDRQEAGTIRAEYDAVGNRIRVRYPGGRVVRQGFDDLNRLVELLDEGPGTSIATQSYAGRARQVGLERANGVTTRRAFDALHRVTRVSHGNAGGALLDGQAYGFDREDRRTFRAQLGQGGRGAVYAYDSLGRLVESKLGVPDPAAEVATPGSQPVARRVGLELDLEGNREVEDVDGVRTAYRADARHAYVEVGGVSRSHDLNGNLQADGRFRYAYDYADRLIEVRDRSSGALVLAHRYDALGRRTTRIAPGAGGTRHELQFAGQVVQERAPGGSVAAEYVYGSNTDELVQLRLGGVDYYAQLDGQGNLTSLSDAAGALVERYAYAAHGAPTIYVGPGPDGSWHTDDDQVAAASRVGNRFLFAGREYEPETGLYAMRARHYDPATGRFLQTDPLGLGVDANPYQYGLHDPINLRDPWGESPETPEGEADIPDIEESESGRKLEPIPSFEYQGKRYGRESDGRWYELEMRSIRIFDQKSCQWIESIQWVTTDKDVTDWVLELLQGDSALADIIEAFLGGFKDGAWDALWELLKAIPDLIQTFIDLLQGGPEMLAELVEGLKTLLNDPKALAALGIGNLTGLGPERSREVLDLLEEGDAESVARAIGLVVGALVVKGAVAVATLAAISKLAKRAKRRTCGGGRRSPKCFLAGTLVETPGGRVPIEELRPGDEVLARDPETGAAGVQRVERVVRGQALEVVSLELAETDGSDRAVFLECTPEHPFWTPAGGWVSARELAPGMLLESRDGSGLRIVSRRQRMSAAPTFNLQVSEWHTFFVAATAEGPALLVHNNDPNALRDEIAGLETLEKSLQDDLGHYSMDDNHFNKRGRNHQGDRAALKKKLEDELKRTQSRLKRKRKQLKKALKRLGGCG